MDDWFATARRNARSVQTTIGWIFWDPQAIANYEALGLPAPVGYIAARAAPLAAAGPEAVVAAFGSISPAAIRFTFELVERKTTFNDVWTARDDAVVAGLHRYAPAIVEPLAAIGPKLWPVVEQLPAVGRVFFAAHLDMPRPDDALLSGWHAINCLREWRGDTHWALVAAADLTGIEASILHNAWLNYEPDWLPRSRGSNPEELTRGWQLLEEKGLAADGRVTDDGLALRQGIEDDTDRICELPWRVLGVKESQQFPADFEPPCELLLRRVDETAGPNYQPASRIRDGSGS